MKRLLCWLILLPLGLSAQAKVIYVNQNAGGAVHDGSSWSDACLTVASGLSGATSGDELWVAKGTYAQMLVPGAGVGLYGGFAGSETTRAQRNVSANRTVLDGYWGEYVVSCRWPNITVDGFTIQNARTGVQVLSGAVAVTNNAIARNDMGIRVEDGDSAGSEGAALTIAGNAIRGNRFTGIALYTPGQPGSTAIVAGNAITGNGWDGVYSEPRIGLSLTANVIAGNKGCGVNIRGGAILANNTVSSNSAAGVRVAGGPVTLVNNSLTGNCTHGLEANGSATLLNNVIAFNAANGVYVGADGTLAAWSYNDLYGNAGGDIQGSKPDYVPPVGPGNITVDPKLSNPYHDVHLQPDSPCRDAGDSAAAVGATDVDGQARILGGKVDMGADESDGTAWNVPHRIWHVSPSGLDDADGLTWATAVKTLTHALTLPTREDEVWVAKGIYPELNVSPGGGVALYGGFAGTETERGQRDWQANPAMLDGGEIPNQTLLSCASPGIVVDGLTVARGGHALNVTAGDAAFANVTVTRCWDDAVLVAGARASFTNCAIVDNEARGLDSRFSAIELTGNTIARNTECAIGITEGTARLQDNAITDNYLGLFVQYAADPRAVTLTGNVISGNWGSGFRASESAATLMNNLIVGNGCGVLISQGTGALINNSIIGNAGAAGIEIQESALTAANNILAFNGGYGFSWRGETAPTFVHNDVFGNVLGSYLSFTPAPDSGNLEADPRVANPYRDGHIQPDSPCRNAGDSAFVSLPTDVDGQPRVQGEGVDIGADESDGTSWPDLRVAWKVAPDGDDGASGQTWAAAKRTIGAALRAARGGDEVWVARGTYNESRLRPAAGVGLYGGFAGTEADRDQRDWRTNATVLDGGRDGGPDTILDCKVAGAVVDGFTMRNGSAAISGENGSAAVRNSLLVGNWTGVSVGFAHVSLIDDAIIGSSRDGVYLGFGTLAMDRCQVRGSGGDGVEVWGGAAKLTNSVLANNAGCGVLCSYTGAVSLGNDTIVGNALKGVSLDWATASSESSLVAFNLKGGVSCVSGSVIAAFSRNDVFGNGAGDFLGFIPPADGGAISLDPLFIDRANGNYRLQAGSPCIDAGDDAAVAAGALDADGKPRISGPHVDIGAYEYNAATAPFTLGDVQQALRIAAGLVQASDVDIARLNGDAEVALTIGDCVRLARAATH